MRRVCKHQSVPNIRHNSGKIISPTAARWRASHRARLTPPPALPTFLPAGSRNRVGGDALGECWPIATIWGDGRTSSSDRQFFRSAKRGDAAGEINARYGFYP